MRPCPILAVAALLGLTACNRANEGTAELVRELRAMRGTLERMQGSDAGTARPAAGSPVTLGAAALQRALEPLRELVQTLLTEQEALRGRQDALAGEMTRWAQILAPVLQGSQATDLQALQDRLQKLETELRAQATRHQEVQELLLRAMNSTSERLDAFLRTLGEIRNPGGTSGTDGAEGTPPPSQPDRGNAEPPDDRPSENAPAAGETIGRRVSRSAAEQWTPWILLAGGAMAFLFLWRLWREPSTPPLAQPVAEHDVQDWWVVVEELAQAMAAQPGAETPALEEDVPEPVVYDDAAGEERDALVADQPTDQPAEQPVDQNGDPEPDVAARVPDEVARQLQLPDPEPAPASTPAAEPEPEAAASPVRVSRPATDRGPAVLEWDEPCADPQRVAVRLREWLLQEPRILLRPAPVVETSERRLRLRAWVMGDMPVGERRHVWTAAQQVLRAGSASERS